MSDDSVCAMESPTTVGEEENGNGGNESRGDTDGEGPSKTESFEKDFRKTAIINDNPLGEQGFQTNLRGAPATAPENSIADNLLIPVSQGREMLVERNKHQSPLLKLPAELRMKIWGFATGGHVVKFRGENFLEACKVFSPCIRKRKEYETWRFCWINSTKPYLGTFRLLRLVCRQMRAEVHIAPYEHNNFHFRSFSVFERFINGISQAQLEAIREISFGGPLGFVRQNFYNEKRDTPPESRKGVAGILPPNLKRIFVDPKAETYHNLRRNRVRKSLRYDIKEVRSLLGLAADQGPLGIKVLVLNVLDRKQDIEDALQAVDV